MKWLIAVLAGLVVASGAGADELAPNVMIKNVANDVLSVVRKDKDIQTGDAHKAAALVETKVLPHFNFVRMTLLALGKDWRKASPAQQGVLIDEFRTLLVRTYSKALTEYRNQTIDYKPLKMKPTDAEVTVHTLIRQSGAKPVQLDYDMEKSDRGWLVYDIAVGGVSLVTNYRGSFAEEISANGIDGLIKSLHSKNQSDTLSVSQKQ